MAGYTGAIGIAAGIISACGFIPYIIDTVKGRARPNRATWSIWSVLGVIAFASYYSAGARDSIYAPAGYMLGQIAVAALSVRYGKGGFSALDLACLCGAGAALALWAVSRSPMLALGMVMAADAFGAVPTIRKAYRDPASESFSGWLLLCAGNALNLFAISEWSLDMAAYPVYFFIINGMIFALVLRRLWTVRRA